MDIIDALWQALKESAYAGDTPAHLEARREIEQFEARQARIADMLARIRAMKAEIRAKAQEGGNEHTSSGD